MTLKKKEPEVSSEGHLTITGYDSSEKKEVTKKQKVCQ